MTTARDFLDAAVRMARRAELSALRGDSRMVRAYCRRRDYAALRAQRLGVNPWSAIDSVVRAFSHQRGAA